MESTKFEKYEIIEIDRSDLKNAPYNPRKINPRARKKLKEKISRVGLLEPPIWNERTGHIVAGHQRVAVLDLLEGKKDYRLRVARVDLDEKTEKEMVVFLNNPEAMGEWDLPKLEAIFREEGIDFEATGFDLADIYKLFGDNPLVERPDQLIELSRQLREATSRYEKIREKTGSRDDADFYLVVVFKSHEERKKWTDAHGLEDNRFVDAPTLLSALEKP